VTCLITNHDDQAQVSNTSDRFIPMASQPLNAAEATTSPFTATQRPQPAEPMALIADQADLGASFDARMDCHGLDTRNRDLPRIEGTRDLVQDPDDLAEGHAVTDGLTGLHTHSVLKELLEHEVLSSRRTNTPVSLIFADVDHFNRVNARYSPSFGDRVIKEVAEAIRCSTRSCDIVSRYAGEEFVIMLPHTTGEDAAKLAERVRRSVESRSINVRCKTGSEGMHVTISLGVATFPQDAADAATLLQHAEQALFAAKQAGRNKIAVFGRTRSSQSEPRVLIVDDEERNVRLLEAYLEAESYETFQASNGEEALETARRLRPDLILLDGIMPGVHGFDVCRRLKQERATSLIPVMLITSLNGSQDRLRGIEAGADDFLNKPVNREELLARVRSLIRSKRSTDLLEDAETVIFTLARAVESRDPSTGGHVERVSHYALQLGKVIELQDTQLEGLRRAGVVHDIGKIAVPDHILLKPGKLTPEERKIMERHVEVGYELLQPLRTFAESLPAVRFHHERLDGSGYPLHLRGEQVPLVAQVMAIVDVYDALTTDRVYRPALNKTEAIQILREEACRGLHDSALVEKFVQLVHNAN
jgi:putative two-component system response regulator